jgi:hypothetical protein
MSPSVKSLENKLVIKSNKLTHILDVRDFFFDKRVPQVEAAEK